MRKIPINPDWLRKEYVENKQTIYQIAKMIGCNPVTVYYRLVKLNIPRRKSGVQSWSEEQKQLRRDWWKKHPNHKPMLGKRLSMKTRKLMSLIRRGKLNPNWKGGVTESIRLFRKSKRYQQWRRKVLKRDKAICQICGKENSSVVHHLKAIKENPEFRFDIDNGLIVCLACHNKIHKRKVSK